MKGKIWFESPSGNRICGILSSTDNMDFVTILCHGFASSKEGKTSLELEKALNKENVSTLRFDFFGHGESSGKFEAITISESVDDALSAIEFARKKGYKHIGLIGSSFGGMASLVAASKSNDLSFLVLKSPVSAFLGKIVAQKSNCSLGEWEKKGSIDYANNSGEKLKLNYSFYKDSAKIDGYSCAKKIKIVPRSSSMSTLF